jgi:hypothetical protein
MSLLEKLLLGHEALATKEVLAFSVPTSASIASEPCGVDSCDAPNGTCAVCAEEAADVLCDKYCGLFFHVECLPELRGRKLLGLPVWANWVCPKCRGIHRLGPVVVSEGGDPFISTQERSANRSMMSLMDVASGLRHGAARSLHRLYDEACRQCGGAGSSAAPLICCDHNACNRAWHVGCVPELASAGTVPAGVWHCPDCPPVSPSAVDTNAIPFAVSLPQAAISGIDTAVEACRSSAEEKFIPEHFMPLDDFLIQWAGGEKAWSNIVQRVQADRVKVELRNPPQFTRLKCNRWTVRRPKLASRGSARSRAGDGDTCLCHLTRDPCGSACLNRSLNMECTRASCGYGDDETKSCHNRDMQRHNKSKVVARPTGGKGWGLFASEAIMAGAFVIEVGWCSTHTMCLPPTFVC